MASQSFNLNLNINANANSAQNQLKNLQKQLQDISNMKIDLGTSNLTADIEKASEAAMKLSAHLATATNPQTGNLDFTKFYTSIQKSGASLEDYGKALQNMGPAGQKAFVSLADSISKAEIPLKRTSKLVDGMWDNLKKTVGWQLSSSMVHGFIGSMQQAMGYAKDLNKSLTDIRIVTGASTDQMAQFAKQANQAAKNLSTTTTDYTKASLIYYQQGLSDQEVKARTETTIKMANATGTSAQKVSDQMTAIWNNFDNGTKSLTHYADVMTALGAATASSTDEIAEGLQKFASISDTVGLSYEYAASALATITSTSRESADVVGNSLKTLFSRIQGLQLGETLDDGTTLNKYSTAMSKVGISIKDSSGELKSMDNILDEMGNKWQTLASDEKMALAQTVAGVRQYTQLMTLMENWDQFKSNVNIANTSGGTLDAQAAIYAESWEAASDRVRASWEGLWDNLISSDGFIAALDMTSGLIGMLDNMVTGLGGAGGALASFGGILTKVFNKQIASTISDVAYSVKMLKPGALEDMKKNQLEFINQAKASMSQDYINPLYGPNESRIRRESMSSSLDASRAFLENRDHMNEEQLLLEQMFANQDRAVQQQKIEAARALDEAHVATADSYFKLFSDTENMSNHYLENNQFYRTKEGKSQEDLNNDYNSLINEQLQLVLRENTTYKDWERVNEIETQLPQMRQQMDYAKSHTYKDELTSRASKLAEIYQGFNNVFKNNGSKEAESTLQSLTDLVTNLGDPNNSEAIRTLGNSEFFTNLSKGLQGLQFETDANGNRVLTAESSQYLSQQMAQLQGFSTTSMAGLADQITERIRASGKFTGDTNELQLQVRELAQNYLAENYAQHGFDNINMRPFDPNNENDPRVQNMRKQETQNKAEAAVAGAQGAMQTLAAVESFKALGHELENLGNGTTSLMSVLSGMTSLSLNAASGFQGLHMAMSQFFTTLSPKAVTGWSLGIMGALAAVSLAFEAFDYFTTSAQEYATSIARSTQNLQNAATTTAEAFEQSQNDSETHLANVRKIESYSQDPSKMANAIYEANKQAIDMITKYGQNWVKGNEYTVDQNTGLIKIKENTLEDVQSEKESISEDFERTANLAQVTQQLESASFALKEFDIGRTKEATEQIINQFSRAIELASPQDISQYKNGEKSFTGSINGRAITLSPEKAQYLFENLEKLEQAQLLIDLIAQQNTGKILENKGYTSQDTRGYQFLQQQSSEVYSKAYQDAIEKYSGKDYVGGRNGWIDQLDPKAIDMAERYLEAQGRSGVEGLKYRNGELKYYSDDTSGEQSIEWEDVKRWQAEQDAEKAVTGIGEDGKSWLDNKVSELQTLYQDIGESAEAVLSFQNFDGNLNQVSVKSLSAAYNELTQSGKNVGKMQTILGKSFDDFKQKVINTYEPVKTFEDLFVDLSSTADKDVLSMEGLQNLDKNIKDFVGSDALQEAKDWLSGKWNTDTNEDGKANFEDMSSEAQNLVKYTEGIEQMLQSSGLDAEGMAQAFNQIAQLDWTDDAGTNLRNIVATIGNLGGDINIADWDHLRGIMQDLSGIMPDYSGTIAQLIQIQQLLNSLKSGDAVTAEINVLLNMMGIKTISDGKGGFIVTSSQEEIDSAAGSNQAEINEKVTSRRNTTSAYNNYKTSTEAAGGVARTQFNSYEDLQTYASENGDFTDFLNNASGTQFGTDIVNGSLPESSSSGPGDVWYNTPWMRSMLSQWGVDTTGWEESTTDARQEDVLNEVNGMMEAGQEGVPTEDIQSLAATYEDAAGLMEAINAENSAFRNEDGLVDSGTLEYLKTLPETSERATKAINQFAEAETRLQELKNSGASEGEISNAQSIADEAAAYAELQTAIDTAAAARELDAEAIASHVSRFQGEIDKLTNSQGKVIESTKDYNKRLMALAIEYEENSEGLADLQSAYKDYNSAVKSGDQRAQTRSWENMRKAIAKITKLPLNKVTDEFMKQAKNAKILEKALKGDVKAIAELEDLGRMEALTDATSDVGKALQTALKGLDFGEGIEGAKNFVSELNSVLAQTDMGQMISDANAGTAQVLGALFDSLVTQFGGGTEGLMKAAKKMNGLGIGVTTSDSASSDVSVDYSGSVTELEPDGYGGLRPKAQHDVEQDVDGEGQATGIKFYDLGGGGGSSGGGGGGGGGGAKEPKKVANKRKSQTVKRYKRNDYRRKMAEKSKASEENKKDYLYGESKIAQMEKINRLAQKEANITADRIKESRQYLVEDRQNLIKYMQKYGFEAEFDADGFLSNYEEAWTAIYKEIAALYEDNLLTEGEEKIEEDLNVKLEELEGALEDYENSLSELADDIEAYEESLYEMYDNKVEALQHKVEFKIELEEDDLEYLDFWIETLGDNIYNSIEAIEAMGEKANMLFNGLDVYKQGVQDIYDLSDDPLQVWATGGLEEVLTQDQVDALRENRDGLMDYMQQLIDLREEIKDKVLDTFDSWQEKIDATAASLEHYTSVIEHFKNIIDIVGKDPFGLSDEFMNRLEQNAINQSMDNIEANKAYYESLIEQQQKAEEELANARQRGDESSVEHWEEVVRTTTEAAQSAQDTLLTSLEDTLTMIAEQFETAMQRAVDAFNDAIYEYGGMEGLANDYNMIRENADLMAADYEKIYELSKLTRDINKVLDDTNIVAGKKKMNGLLKEINALQADGVELSKYDLEYLRAKYELRLAEIELENAQNSKDTVRLSKDSEGNWSYVYTQNADAVEEAEQKYEDALYEMQNLSQEYLEEMSSMMLDTSQSMMEEISALRIQDFTSYEAYQAEIKHIQDKYAESLRHQENELNKAVQNSSDLYKQDWQTYNQITGYKISLTENWVDSFKETTLGDIMDIDTFMSGFSDTFLGLTDEMSAQLANAAIQYFKNVDSAMNTYGTSIEQFGQMTTVTIDNIQKKSQSATEDMKIMAKEMSDAFKEIADYVSNWQEEFSGQIDTMLEEIKELVQSINEAISKSAELAGEKGGAGELIGSAEAIELLNATGQFGSWSSDGGVGLKVDGKSTNFVDYNAALIEEIDDAVARYANAKTGTEEREKLGEELKELFKRYWQFRDIVSRVYDPTNLTTNMEAPSFTSFDTGGYTGEWGKEGRMAMLHEKELILNSHDTSNFLDALNISRDIIHSMIEMNARASSLGFGNLSPSTIPEWDQTFEQTVTITAEFPDATNHNEIEEAFNNLLNTASQYANRNL